MPSRRVVGRISLRDQMLRNQQSMDLYAALADKPRHIIDIPDAPKPRAPSMPSNIPLESDVLADIVDRLLDHPMVGLVERINSGTAVENNAFGDRRYISFNHVYRVPGIPSYMRASDLSVTLKGGHWAGRRLAIEVKRPGWRAPRDKREEEQFAYLLRVRTCGGYGLFATSWQDVAAELERIKCESPTESERQTISAAVHAALRPRGRASD